MVSKLVVLLVCAGVVVGDNSCYWNSECPYKYFSSKTPYDAVRGDIRDYADPPNCSPVSIWSIHRHGNRNPGSSVTAAIRVIADLKDEIIASYDAGRSQLCAQDIEEFRRWTWNDTLEVSASHLTGVGYEELYDIGRRLREKYPRLLNGTTDAFYFRPTDEQRTITSAIAFVHGLTDGTNLSLTIDDVRERDDVIRPYENCDNYQENVKTAPAVENAVFEFASTDEYRAVQSAVQQRLGITTQLTTEDIYSFYEICRFLRSWTETLKSPWCSVFTNEDLVVLEYRDDVRHYYRNGYGSWVNVRLGAPAMKDLYQNFQAVVEGQGRNIVSYFTHDTMMEMIFCSLGLYHDETPLVGSKRNVDRIWRTSIIASMANNIISILYNCQESGSQAYRVQILHNEQLTEICPANGCTWAEFQQKFQPFEDSNLDFCSLDYPEPDSPYDGSAVVQGGMVWLMLVQLVVTWFWR